ncbi:hypothetical protein MNV49_007568 [Pseudohyphozyma bogoriensis]|nr:hypothetical protein MNV49_007568 [Pseudohyphozyma bogoriensis]
MSATETSAKTFQTIVLKQLLETNASGSANPASSANTAYLDSLHALNKNEVELVILFLFQNERSNATPCPRLFPQKIAIIFLSALALILIISLIAFILRRDYEHRPFLPSKGPSLTEHPDSLPSSRVVSFTEPPKATYHPSGTTSAKLPALPPTVPYNERQSFSTGLSLPSVSTVSSSGRGSGLWSWFGKGDLTAEDEFKRASEQSWEQRGTALPPRFSDAGLGNRRKSYRQFDM